MTTRSTPPKNTKEAHPRYYGSVGRRKTSVARVRITPGKGKVTVNNKEIHAYLQIPALIKKALEPLKSLKVDSEFDVSVKVSGSGIHAQSEAIRHGLSRALVLVNPDFKKRLRVSGFLTRDSRMVERKKYGLKKARRAPQWQKR